MSVPEMIIATVLILFGISVFLVSTRRKIAMSRSVDMVFLRVIIARKDSDLDEKKETVKDFREQISIMEQLFSSLKSLYSHTINGWLFGQEYISFEYVAHKEEIYFYVVIPRKSKLLVEKQILGFYPDSIIEETEEINIFADRPVVCAEIMGLKKPDSFPIRTYQKLESDSMNAILSALGKLSKDESASIQFLLRPADDDWQNRIKKMIRKTEKKDGHHGFGWNPLVWIGNFLELIVRSPEDSMKHSESGEGDKDDEPIDDE